MISLMTSVWLELSELMSQLLASMVRSGKDLVYSDCESSFFFFAGYICPDRQVSIYQILLDIGWK